MGRCRGAASKCVQCHPFPEYFKDFPIKSLIDSLFWWHKFLVDDPLTVKKTNEHRFDLGFAHSRFLGTGRVCSVPLPTLAFCLGVVLKKLCQHNLWFVSSDDQHDVLETCRELKNKNKYTVKNCASRCSFTKNHNMIHGQQNVKFCGTNV
jgi:hypothetical protein